MWSSWWGFLEGYLCIDTIDTYVKVSILYRYLFSSILPITNELNEVDKVESRSSSWMKYSILKMWSSSFICQSEVVHEWSIYHYRQSRQSDIANCRRWFCSYTIMWDCIPLNGFNFFSRSFSRTFWISCSLPRRGGI